MAVTPSSHDWDPSSHHDWDPPPPIMTGSPSSHDWDPSSSPHV